MGVATDRRGRTPAVSRRCRHADTEHGRAVVGGVCDCDLSTRAAVTSTRARRALHPVGCLFASQTSTASVLWQRVATLHLPPGVVGDAAPLTTAPLSWPGLYRTTVVFGRWQARTGGLRVELQWCDGRHVASQPHAKGRLSSRVSEADTASGVTGGAPFHTGHAGVGRSVGPAGLPGASCTRVSPCQTHPNGVVRTEGTGAMPSAPEA
jgi:hypothetical protein